MVKVHMPELCNIHKLHSLPNLPFILLRENAQHSGIGIAACGNHILTGHHFGLDPLCQHHGRLGGKLLAAHVIYGASVYIHRSPDAFKVLCNGLEYGGFSCAVWTYQREDTPSFQAYLDVAYQRFAIISHGKLLG